MMNIYFVHMGKTGGLSLQKALKTYFGEEHCFDIVDLFVDTKRFKKTNPQILYGHSTLSLSKLLNKPLIYTMLRTPVSRIISYWEHVVRENQDIVLKHLYTKDWQEVVKDKNFISHCCNTQTKILGMDVDFNPLLQKTNVFLSTQDKYNFWGVKYAEFMSNNILLRPCTDDIYTNAKYQLTKIKYGLFENYDLEIKQLFKKLGFSNIVVPQLNKRVSSTSIFDSVEAKQALYQLNFYDNKLYEYAKAMKNE